MVKAQIAIWIIFMIVGFAIGSFLWPYTLNTWLVYFGKDPSIVWWQGGLIGFIPWIGQASIPAAAVTWILMLFIK